MKNYLLNFLFKQGYVVFVLFALVPIFVSTRHILTYLIYICIFSILTIGLNLLMGYAGQISVGSAAFYAIGAYASALLTLRFKLPFLAGFLVAGLAAGAIGYLVGYSALRIKGFYLALATFAFAE